MSLNEGKDYIRNIIIPYVDCLREKSSIRGEMFNELMKIFDEYRPDISEFIRHKNNKNIKIKYHILYCFLNDVYLTRYTNHFIIDKDRNRVIEDISLKEFAKIVDMRAISFDSALCKYGFDIKYPKIMNYDTKRIRKIIKKLKAQYIKCKVCHKFTKVTHKGQTLCSVKCQLVLASERMKVKNPSITHPISIETRKRISKRIRESIANGTFTPCITNSWANSKVNIKEFGCSFRSSWEAYFYLKMKKSGHNILHEKVRIKYYDSILNKTRTYITDFVDYDNKIIYEIKPNGCIDTQNVKDKEYAAKQYCNENGYQFVFISNDWFYENYNESIIYEYDISEENKNKLKKLLNQFKGK